MNYDDRMREQFLRWLMLVGAKVLTGARAVPPPTASERGVSTVYFANHVSHGDFVLVWAVLDAAARERTRPVAAADYWNSSPLKRFIGQRVVRALLIEREREKRALDPVTQMVNALDSGESLILFPEGTRNLTDAPLLPFKSGLYHLATQRPQLRLVPAWIDNLHRVLPKGEVIPIPLLCTVYFGAPMVLQADESKADFLARAQAALLGLKPE
jgi:1-acyl-sn-glycerol-3-phosphate acyltransferase